jgi:hypothetical protein
MGLAVTRPLLLSLTSITKYSYQFVIVGHWIAVVPVRKHQQLAVAVECQVHIKLIRYAGQEVGQQSGFDFGERRRSSIRFGTCRTARPSLCKSRNT